MNRIVKLFLKVIRFYDILKATNRQGAINMPGRIRLALLKDQLNII